MSICVASVSENIFVMNADGTGVTQLTCAALPVHAPLIDESKIDFVDERSGLEGVVCPLAAKMAPAMRRSSS